MNHYRSVDTPEQFLRTGRRIGLLPLQPFDFGLPPADLGGAPLLRLPTDGRSTPAFLLAPLQNFEPHPVQKSYLTPRQNLLYWSHRMFMPSHRRLLFNFPAGAFPEPCRETEACHEAAYPIPSHPIPSHPIPSHPIPFALVALLAGLLTPIVPARAQSTPETSPPAPEAATPTDFTPDPSASKEPLYTRIDPGISEDDTRTYVVNLAPDIRGRMHANVEVRRGSGGTTKVEPRSPDDPIPAQYVPPVISPEFQDKVKSTPAVVYLAITVICRIQPKPHNLGSKSAEQARVLVESEDQEGRRLQSPVLDWIWAHGGDITDYFPITGVLSVRLPAGAVEDLARHPGVVSVDEPRSVHPTMNRAQAMTHVKYRWPDSLQYGF